MIRRVEIKILELHVAPCYAHLVFFKLDFLNKNFFYSALFIVIPKLKMKIQVEFINYNIY